MKARKIEEGIQLGLSEKESENQVYICGNKTAIPLADIMRHVRIKEKGRPITLRLPAWPFFALGYLCEKICPRIGMEPPIYRRRVAFFTKDRSFDTNKLHSVKNLDFSYDNHTGLSQTLEWYKQNNWL